MQFLFLAEKTRKQKFLPNFGLSLFQGLVKHHRLSLSPWIDFLETVLITVSGVISIIPELFTNSEYSNN